MKYAVSAARFALGSLLAFSLVASLPSDAGDTRQKKMTGISYVHEDVGRLDLIRDPENLDNNVNFLGQIVGKYKYLIVRRPDDRAFIAAYYKGRHLFSVPDQEVDIDGGGNWGPGETAKGYDFYMSPSRRYLFVERGLITDLGVALLFKKSGRGWSTASATRFDDAALNAYCRYRHLDPNKLAGPSRLVHFVKWDIRHGKLVFWMSAASFWFSDKAQRGDLAADWTASCRLRDMRFHIISDKIYRFRKPGWLPR